MDISTPQSEIIKQSASVIPFVIKLALVGGVVYYAYNQFRRRFIPWKENTSYPAANITHAQAQAKADAIFGAVGWFGGDFPTLQNNLAGLNYNGYVRLHNAFGERDPGVVGFLNEDLELEPWLRKVVSDDDLFMQLSTLTNGAFF